MSAGARARARTVFCRLDELVEVAALRAVRRILADAEFDHEVPQCLPEIGRGVFVRSNLQEERAILRARKESKG